MITRACGSLGLEKLLNPPEFLLEVERGMHFITELDFFVITFWSLHHILKLTFKQNIYVLLVFTGHTKNALNILICIPSLELVNSQPEDNLDYKTF